jgi:hypothetical protein
MDRKPKRPQPPLDEPEKTRPDNNIDRRPETRQEDPNEEELSETEAMELKRREMERRELEEQEHLREREEMEMMHKEREEQNKRPDREKPGDFFLWRTYANREGFYRFDDLRPGHYEMRVFAKGHIMYYNEINVRDQPQRIDVYLLREPVQKPKLSIITGTVYDKETKEPVAGAMVCVVPPELVRKFLEMHNKEIGEPMDMDLEETIELDTEFIDVEPGEFDKEMPDPNMDKDIWYDEKPITDKPMNKDDMDKNMKTRAEREGKPDEQRPDQKPDNEEDKKPEIRKELLRKFCTKTNEKGQFKLVIPAGAHVLVVKARGYKPFIHKFFIKPHQKMVVKVPIMPRDTEEQNLDKPELSMIDEDAKTTTTEGSETQDMQSGLAESTTSVSSILGSVLGVLVLIALFLGTLVWKKRPSKSGEKKINK